MQVESSLLIVGTLLVAFVVLLMFNAALVPTTFTTDENGTEARISSALEPEALTLNETE